MRTHDTLAVANWFLARAEREDKPLTPMKLQKLIYFAHGWSLALTEVPLIDERPQAWDYGPVIPSVYHAFKEFGRQPITKRARKPIADPNQELPAGLPTWQRLLRTLWTEIEPEVENDPDAEALLARVWEVYGHLSAAQLSNMAHVPGSAWDQAYRKASGKRGGEISDSLIRTEFEQKAPSGANASEAAPRSDKKVQTWQTVTP